MGATTAIIRKHSFHYVTNGGTISKSCSTVEQEQELTMIVSSSVITRDPINHPLPDQDILRWQCNLIMAMWMAVRTGSVIFETHGSDPEVPLVVTTLLRMRIEQIHQRIHQRR